ncbi:MAG: MFS transporter [Pseudomonadota bacterium]
MLAVIGNVWALLIGVFLLMVGNALQSSLLGIRGALEGMDAATLSYIMSAYFIGFLGGSQLTPRLIRRVGHIRVFAALGSLLSAAFILYPVWPEPVFWFFLRLIVGFCFSGVYIVAESWLNNAATNETRGATLGAYAFVVVAGVVGGQLFLNIADPSAYFLFIFISVIVSIAFAPILLSVTPAPYYEATKPMTVRELIRVSPFGCFGMLVIGTIFSALFGMSAVYATEKGLSVAELSIFVAAIYVGGLAFQVPIAWISDRMDRRLLVVALCLVGAGVCVIGAIGGGSFAVMLAAGAVMGGIANPLYPLLIAYTNDYLEHEDMAAASGGLVFLNGLGAIAGPVVIGALMASLGADAYFGVVAVLFGTIAAYGFYRMTQRAAPSVEDTSAYAAMAPIASPASVEFAQEAAIEMAEAAEEEAAEEEGDGTRAA